MSGKFPEPIIVETTVTAGIQEVWNCWTRPEDIMQWNNPGPEWHTTEVVNDLRPGGKFLFKTGLKDGSFHFDFAGTYEIVETHSVIRYTLDDGRWSEILFTGSQPVRVREKFVPQNEDPLEMQRDFCASVLDAFRRHVEGKP